MTAGRHAAALVATLLVAGGCAGTKQNSAVTAEAVKPAAPPAAAVAPSARTPAVTPAAPAPAVHAAAPVAAPPPVAGAPKPAAAAPSPRPAPRAPSPPATAVAPVPPAVKPAAAPPAPTAAPAPAPAPAVATLDLKSLEQRLRETRAIGLFTKLALKNQVDDLLDKFRAHHAGKPNPPVAELRQNFDGLMLKVLALLQDGDPGLAKTIGSSRDALWNILNDPVKLTNI